MKGNAKDRFKKWKPPKIKHGKLTKWNWMVNHPKKLKLGENVDIGAFTFINAIHGVEIGDDVQIGGGCFIYSISTIGNKTGRVVLEEGCMIGANSVIMPGVTVGKNAVVGAGTFVNRDVPANHTIYTVRKIVKRKNKLR